MEVILIRHAKVNYLWKRYYNSRGFETACKEYDSAEIFFHKRLNKINTDIPVYISELQRSKDTAKLLFSNQNFIETELLNEVKISPFIKTNFKIPLWFWLTIGRLQWQMSIKTQKETKQITKNKNLKFLKTIEELKKDCFVIGHGFNLYMLSSIMKKHNWNIPKIKYIKNLQIIKCSKII